MRIEFNEAVELFSQEVISRIMINPIGCGLTTDNSTMLRFWGPWHLLSKEGVLLDKSTNISARTEFALWQLCKKRIVDVKASDLPGGYLILEVDDGTTLHVQNEPDGYTSWTLAGPGFSFGYDGGLF